MTLSVPIIFVSLLLLYGTQCAPPITDCDFLAQLSITPGYVFSENTVNPDITAAKQFLIEGLNSIDYIGRNWNITEEDIASLADYINNTDCSNFRNPSSPFQFHPYTPIMEGTISAPESHTLVYRNDLVNVVNWILKAGVREKYHTHGLASVMFFPHASRAIYYDENGIAGTPHLASNKPQLAAPEWLHSVENVDTLDYHVIRILYNPRYPTSYHWPSTDRLD